MGGRGVKNSSYGAETKEIKKKGRRGTREIVAEERAGSQKRERSEGKLERGGEREREEHIKGRVSAWRARRKNSKNITTAQLVKKYYRGGRKE